MDGYAHLVYDFTKTFPNEEKFGVTSQLRRSTLSVILNCIEGFARMKPGSKLSFWQISYGSLQESKYLLEFCFKESYIDKNNYDSCLKAARSYALESD